jgi:hypothetical protein
MPGLSTAKLIGIAVAAAAILTFVLLSLHWKSQAADRKQKLEIICTTTRAAADDPKLSCGNVTLQIGELGASVKNLKAALAKQNAAVNALATESDRQKAEASQAVLKAQGRAQAAQATSARLMASARSGSAPAGSAAACKPSKTLEGAWQ